MKTLFVIRHAKSSWDDTSLSDHDRPLNERGLRDAVRMGKALKDRGVQPDVILSSTANRARTTASMIAEALEFPDSDITEGDQWYLAPAKLWLRSVQQIDEDASAAMIFGHNPGMHDFAEQILENESISRFPTLAVAHLEWDLSYWGEIDWRTARLAELLLPKEL